MNAALSNNYYDIDVGTVGGGQIGNHGYGDGADGGGGNYATGYGNGPGTFDGSGFGNGRYNKDDQGASPDL